MDKEGALQVLLYHPFVFLDKFWITLHQVEDLVKTINTFDP